MSSVKRFTSSKEKNIIETGVLYLVATPIGNLSDLSERAIKVLSEADIVAAEDTRNTAKLLTLLGISKPMISYFEHNKRERGEEIVSHLREGKTVALVTDAGTPAISDPGEDLVVLCAKEGIKVTSVPGACAAINALALSALPTGRFVFEGFLPTSKRDRKERLSYLTDEERTVIFYEAPHKLRNTLSDLLEAFGKDRKITLCREMTKLNEEVFRTTLEGAVAEYEKREPRGEYVLILEGKPKSEILSDNASDSRSVRERVEAYMAAGEEKKEAIKRVAKEMGLPRNAVYQEMIESGDR